MIDKETAVRRLAFTALATVALAAGSPAWAHEEITPATIPTGRPTFLTLSAANEKGADLTGVTLKPPPALAFGEATRQPPGWTAQRSADTVTWSGGRVAPHAFELWGFEIEGADQPGPLRYSITLSFADGSSEDAEVEVVAVAAAGPGPAPATTAAGPTTSVTVALPAAPGARAGSRDDGARSRAGAALAVGVAAGVVALVALGLAARRRPGPAAARATEEGQDW
jgi:hypothetical protein